MKCLLPFFVFVQVAMGMKAISVLRLQVVLPGQSQPKNLNFTHVHTDVTQVPEYRCAAPQLQKNVNEGFAITWEKFFEKTGRETGKPMNYTRVSEIKIIDGDATTLVTNDDGTATHNKMLPLFDFNINDETYREMYIPESECLAVAYGKPVLPDFQLVKPPSRGTRYVLITSKSRPFVDLLKA